LFAGLYSTRGASFQVLKALSQEKIRPVLSVPLLFEYEDVLKRNSRKLGITHEEIDSFLDNVCNLCTFHEIHYLWRPFLRDPKDDLVLELAIAAQASYCPIDLKHNFINPKLLSATLTGGCVRGINHF